MKGKRGRYRFTLGHEVGHWGLHRPLLEAKANQANLFGAVREPAIVCRSSSKEPQEWQADVYSGLMLMPKPLIREQWERAVGSMEPYFAADEIEALQTRWSLAENNTPTVSIARELAQVFKVSGQAMQIRLIGLGLIRIQNPEQQLFMPVY
jgi:Zn-dependent peptidase ImmA (M78 family)